MPKVSICIPTYEMHGEGFSMLKRCLDSLLMQTFKDFEVVISDNSFSKVLLALTYTFKELDIKYIRYDIRNMASNTNNAIKHAKGELIKILYQDDCLAHENALQEIVDNFTDEVNWLATACDNNLYPHYDPLSPIGVNTLGSPSVITIRNKDPLFFKDGLNWLLDCEYYKRMYEKYGLPRILESVGVRIGTGKHQTTNHLTDEEKLKEINLL